MIDMRAVLIMAAIYGVAWGVGETVKGAKWIGHKAKCGITRITGQHCDRPPVQP